MYVYGLRVAGKYKTIHTYIYIYIPFEREKSADMVLAGLEVPVKVGL